jgi:hypothetical protein
MSTKRVPALMMALVILAVSTARAHDEDHQQVNRVLDDTFSISLLGGLVDLSTDVAAGRSLGALVDLEDILGFDDQIATFGLEGFWRVSKNRKHAFRLTYGNFDRDASTAVEGTVPIFDLHFFGELESTFVNQVATLEYQYSFINHHKTEAGITAGLACFRYRLAISGQVVLGDNPEEAAFRSESVGVVAPVPAVGFFINQALRPNLIFGIATSFIDLEIGEHSGRIFRSWGSLTWFLSRHLGIGFGLTGSDVLYDQQSSSERIKVELRQNAVTLNLTAVF